MSDYPTTPTEVMPLFDTPKQAAQDRELQRVTSNIGVHVLEFCRQHVNKKFHLSELESYVASRCTCTPGSAGRVLRDLANPGKHDDCPPIKYRLIDRAKSLYTVLWVEK